MWSPLIHFPTDPLPQILYKPFLYELCFAAIFERLTTDELESNLSSVVAYHNYFSYTVIHGHFLQYPIMFLGKPPPKVRWLKGDRVIDRSSHLTEDDGVKNQLILGNLSRYNLNEILTCQATNDNRSLPVEKSVAIDMNCKYLHLHCSQRFRNAVHFFFFNP